MQRIRLLRTLTIIVLAVAACSSDKAATTTAASAASSAPAATAPTTTSAPAGTEIHASSTAGSPTIGEPICDAEKHCMYPLTVTGTFSGDLTGTSIAHSAGALAGNGYLASDTLIYTGTFAGCGTGTVVVLGTGRGATDGSGTSTWVILEGAGTGDLAGMTGSGTTEFGPGSDGITVTRLTGRITCT